MLPFPPPSLLQPPSLLYVPGTCSLAPTLLPLLAPRPPNVPGLVGSQARLSTAPLQRKSSLITQSEVARPSAPSLWNLPAAAPPHHHFHLKTLALAISSGWNVFLPVLSWQILLRVQVFTQVSLHQRDIVISYPPVSCYPPVSPLCITSTP